MAMVFNASFNNISVISWRSVLMVEETGVNRKQQQNFIKSLTNSVSSTIKTERHDITEILLKEALNTIAITT
jgi:hypothetical protein